MEDDTTKEIRIKFIDPKETNIRTLLSVQQAHIIPPHQRPYSWDKERWEEFLEDIYQLGEQDIHFLGSIVVLPATEAPQLGVNYFYVQDGQQRLTTILVFIIVLRDLVEKHGLKGISVYENCLYTKDYDDNLIPRLKLGDLDNEAFLCLLKKQKRKIRHLIFDCYDFFEREISQKYENNISEGLKELRQKLLEQVYLIHINAFHQTNAFQLFETLNDRGMELSAVDLIKNYLFNRLAFGGEDNFEKPLEIWNEMFLNVKELNPVKFLRRYMLGHFKGKFPERRLHKVLKIMVMKENWDNQKIYDFMTKLNESSSLYRQMLEADYANSSLINKRLSDLLMVEVGPSYTLLLKILHFFEQELIEEKDVLSILDMVEIFHIRWGVCGQSTSVLDDIYQEICIKISDNTNVNSKKILECISEQLDKAIKANVDDFTFEDNFSKRKFRWSEKRTKYILWKLSRPTGETVIDVNEIHTEHIMPRTLNKNWLEYLRSNEDNPDDNQIHRRHSEMCDRIGNLTIIKGRWNQSMSNEMFSKKKDYYAKSDVGLTRDLSQLDDWGFAQIEKRSGALARAAVNNIWKWPPKY